ncbi:ECF transporter S component [Terrilactibacillus laevilacticus]|uniref:ECF transporter S component n=1 Tax=Terrilactibacillus laevilacticus TaxID=1380157 RepID=UPI00114677A4|nr:ECF transporter S component [Terrilactibacillus laevilacticus]
MSKRLKLTDILVTIVIAIVFGLIYKISGPLYDIVKILGFQAEQLTYGIYFIAAPVAMLIIRKPGVALLAEVAAAMMEVLFAGSGGIINFYYGIIQGAFSEIIFLIFAYKKFNLPVTILSGLAAAVGSYILDYYYGYLVDLAGWNILLNVVFRFLGTMVISGFIAFFLVKALEKTGVTNLVRPASKDDYDVLNK